MLRRALCVACTAAVAIHAASDQCSAVTTPVLQGFGECQDSFR